LRHHFTIKIKNNMTKKKKVYLTSQGFVVMSVLCLLSVSIMAFYNPQSVMDLVQVTLPNNDAFSSIRGIYGGSRFGFIYRIAILVENRYYKSPSFFGNALGFLCLVAHHHYIGRRGIRQFWHPMALHRKFVLCLIFIAINT
jgi:hypothetical protein